MSKITASSKGTSRYAIIDPPQNQDFLTAPETIDVDTYNIARELKKLEIAALEMCRDSILQSNSISRRTSAMKDLLLLKKTIALKPLDINLMEKEMTLASKEYMKEYFDSDDADDKPKDEDEEGDEDDDENEVKKE